MTRLAFLLLLAAASWADQFDAIRASIRRKIADQTAPSIAVAVARGGEIIWEEGFGWADRERRVPSDPHILYSLASISKPITATALMILVERGKVDLDKPINDYLGEAKLRGRAGDASLATVRRVANHTSGLPLHYQFFYEDEPYRAPQRDETIRRYGNLITPPGERYLYSNLGYGVLDHVISRVSGKAYADFVREEVLLPLGMRRSAVGLPDALKQHQAVRYGADGLPIPFYDFDHPGGSAVYASAHDLVRFGMFHLKNRLAGQKRILKDASIEEMQRPTARVDALAEYGVGWAIDSSSPGWPQISHTGGMGGVSTYLAMLPKQNIAVAVLCNGRSSLPNEVVREILQVLEPARKRQSAVVDNRRRPLPLGKWKGAVHTENGEIPMVLDIRPDRNVHVRLGSQLETGLSAVSFEAGYFRGGMTGDIGTADANRTKYVLAIELKLRGDVWNGGITARSLPAKRAGNALTYWVELRREF